MINNKKVPFHFPSKRVKQRKCFNVLSKRSQLEIGFRRKLLAALDTLGDDGSLFLANIRPTPNSNRPYFLKRQMYREPKIKLWTKKRRVQFKSFAGFHPQLDLVIKYSVLASVCFSTSLCIVPELGCWAGLKIYTTLRFHIKQKTKVGGESRFFLLL